MKAMRILSILAFGLVPAVAWAEEGEKGAGLEGGLMLPSFSSADATAFALAGPAVRARAEYGLLGNLTLAVGAGFAAFSGQTADTRPYLGRSLSGNLAFDLDQLHFELGARYNLFAGYNLAPYVEASVGFLWATFRNENLLAASGGSYGLTLPDEVASALTGSIGLRVEYRLMNLVRIGLGVRWTEVIGGGLYKRFIEVPVSGTLFW